LIQVRVAAQTFNFDGVLIVELEPCYLKLLWLKGSEMSRLNLTVDVLWVFSFAVHCQKRVNGDSKEFLVLQSIDLDGKLWDLG